MIRTDDVYKIGQFNKPHGIHGELSMTITDDIFDRVEADYIVCPMEGILVPFFIEEYRFRTENTALMKLEDIDSAEQARQFTNVDIYFPIRLAQQDEDFDHTQNASLQGYSVQTIAGDILGEIVDIDDSTINVLFVVDHNGSELLIPAQDDFVVEIDERHKIIVMALPDGLLHLDAVPTTD